MKKINLIALLIVLVFSGCFGDGKQDYTLQQGNMMLKIDIKDQFGEAHKIDKTTKKVIFAFSKTKGKIVKKFLEQQDSYYLERKNIFYVVDITMLPSFIFKYILLPTLQDVKFEVLLLDDEKQSNIYKGKINDGKLLVVTLDKLKITKVRYVRNKQDLEKYINE